jgi:hypothetical protein
MIYLLPIDGDKSLFKLMQKGVKELFFPKEKLE